MSAHFPESHVDPPRSGKKLTRDFEKLDEMSMFLRELVHEFGSELVNTFIESGISRPNQIRHLILSCWKGARSPLDRSGKNTTTAGPGLQLLDWVLMQKGAGISAATLVRVLHADHLVILPLEPTKVGIDASMITVTPKDGPMSKPEKHRRRLRAATRAAARHLWPQLEIPE